MRHSVLLFIAAGLTAAVAVAQEQPPAGNATPAPTAQTPAVSAETSQPAIAGGTPTYVKEETPEQRKERLGTKEDPGLDPDPKVIYTRYGRRYHIEKFDRRWASTVGQPLGFVRPFAFVNVATELYQQNDLYVWVWMREPTPESELPPPTPTYTPEQVAFLERLKLDFAPLEVPPAPVTISFAEASAGLPQTGSWRNGLAVADMNGDGKADIVAPPQRGVAGGLPSIFLGDGKGRWTAWSTRWPAPLDYGDVAAADFNRDGKMDVAFAVHLQGLHVLLGDGQGTFVESSEGLSTDSFPTRRLVVVDLDRDGNPDILSINEGPTSGGSSGGAKIRAFINRNKAKSWTLVDAAVPSLLTGGDTLAVGHFNRDRYPDFVTGSIVYQNTNLLFLSDGARKWESLKSDDGRLIQFYSMYYGVATARVSSTKVDDAIIAFSRYWPYDIAVQAGIADPKEKHVVGIERISFAGKTPQRIPIARWGGERGIMGIATGDFDGDRRQDILYAAWEPEREFVLLLGDGKGGFRRAKLAGIKAEPQSNYALTLADVNHDGRPDVVISYESDKRTKLGDQNGSVHVFLNLGASLGVAAAGQS